MERGKSAVDGLGEHDGILVAMRQLNQCAQLLGCSYRAVSERYDLTQGSQGLRELIDLLDDLCAVTLQLLPEQ